uniref:Callose synthase 9 n=1 Tax=Tanacetum cinerariifolium TaxID=118510 RepID=A0A6L2LXB2_TANCI|nr:callose synthase 9 [Tanacetum cinerariifolium]
MLGEVLKERNIAFDAMCFGDPAENKQELFLTLIALADNNNNCNLLHVPHGSSLVHDALLRDINNKGRDLHEPQIKERNCNEASHMCVSTNAQVVVTWISRSDEKKYINHLVHNFKKQIGNAMFGPKPMRAVLAPMASEVAKVLVEEGMEVEKGAGNDVQLTSSNASVFYGKNENSTTKTEEYSAPQTKNIQIQCEARAYVDLKFTYVITCQLYSEDKKEQPQVADTALLLQR